MSDQETQDTPLAQARQRLARLEELSERQAQAMRGNLRFWAIRWIVAFGVIAAVTLSTGQYFWLWWAGALVAGSTLAAMLGTKLALTRKTDSTRAEVARLEEMLRAAEAEREADS
jgi:cation transport ATPase